MKPALCIVSRLLISWMPKEYIEPGENWLQFPSKRSCKLIPYRFITMYVKPGRDFFLIFCYFIESIGFILPLESKVKEPMSEISTTLPIGLEFES